MDTRILIIGASGSGTTTIGKALAEELHVPHIETDDLFWIASDIPFTKFRTEEELKQLVATKLVVKHAWVLSGSPCGWGDAIIPVFSLVVLLSVPAAVRVARIKERDNIQFGERISEGGDLYDNHQRFLNWTKMYDTGGINGRSKEKHEEWLKGITCPIIRINGELDKEEVLKIILQHS